MMEVRGEGIDLLHFVFDGLPKEDQESHLHSDMTTIEKRLAGLPPSTSKWNGKHIEEISTCIDELSKVLRCDNSHLKLFDVIRDLVDTHADVLAASKLFISALCKVTGSFLRQTKYEPAHKCFVLSLQMWSALVDVGKKPDAICGTLLQIEEISTLTLRSLLVEMGQAKSFEAQELMVNVICKLLMLMMRIPEYQSMVNGIFKDCPVIIRSSLLSPQGPYNALTDMASYMNSINAENLYLRSFNLVSVSVKEIKKHIKGYRQILRESVLEIGFFHLAIVNEHSSITVPYSAIEVLHFSPGCIQVDESFCESTKLPLVIDRGYIVHSKINERQGGLEGWSPSGIAFIPR